MLDEKLIKAAFEYNAIIKSVDVLDDDADVFTRINKCSDLLTGYMFFLALYNEDYILFNLYTGLAEAITNENYECANEYRTNILIYENKHTNV